MVDNVSSDDERQPNVPSYDSSDVESKPYVPPLDDSDLQIDLTQSLKPRQQRKSFLITYSKANVDRFPTRMIFANVVLEAIANAPPKVIITYWSCSKEKHIDGSPHYHFAINFSGPNRWEPIKLYLKDTYGILVHFSVKHLGYNAACKYIIKSDDSYFTSDDHPNLDTIKAPKTKRGMKGNALKQQTKVLLHQPLLKKY